MEEAASDSTSQCQASCICSGTSWHEWPQADVLGVQMYGHGACWDISRLVTHALYMLTLRLDIFQRLAHTNIGDTMYSSKENDLGTCSGSLSTLRLYMVDFSSVQNCSQLFYDTQTNNLERLGPKIVFPVPFLITLSHFKTWVKVVLDRHEVGQSLRQFPAEQTAVMIL